MHYNWYALIVPGFLLFIGLEYLVSQRKGFKFFRFKESVANLNIGIGERVTDLLTTGAFFFLYDWLYNSYALFSVKPTLFTWLMLFLVTDLIWYWYHRLAHEVNIFWAAHIVHHQSEDFNYTASTRITMFQAGIRGSFWAILPVLGFPPAMITAFLLIHGAYPFFTHTRLIGKLGWFEKVFVTPTHHGVHHASDEKYLDKNYGDILIIWDKLFGTYAKQTTNPVYGITVPLKSHSFFWQHFHQFLELFVSMKRTQGLRKKLRILFARPNSIDAAIRPVLERKFLRRDSSPATPELKRYIFIQSALTLILLFFLLLFAPQLSRMQLFIGALFIVVSAVNTGALMEKQRWILYPEVIRFALLVVFLNNFWFSIYSLTFTAGALLWLMLCRKSAQQKFYGLVYRQ